MSHRLWVVLLLVALLPLRGWALGMTDGAAPVAASVAAQPCHDAAPAGTGNAGCPCDLCATCHSPAAAPASTAAVDSPRSPAPMLGIARDTGQRHPERLDRPPRIGLR